jgi:monofunctional biosynthetic peptidoglycan transglycosylase
MARLARLFRPFVRFARVLRWTLRILLIALIADLFYLSVVWPDWEALARGAIPKSAFINAYERGLSDHKDWPRLRWQPVPLTAIPKHLTRAAILAEDANFYGHRGFDLVAFREAMNKNLEEGRARFGASTISQQTAKNLFLSRSRDPLRKWHELILTWGMEQNLSKSRILELYLNVAEFGQGIYGVQAAARHYWGVDVGALSPAQSAELAATLPSPVKNNPATRTKHFEWRSQRVLSLLQRFPGEAAASMAAQEEPVPLIELPPEPPPEELPADVPPEQAPRE